MGGGPLIAGPLRRDPVELSHWLESAYPALGPALRLRPEDVAYVASSGRSARDTRAYRRLFLPSLGDLGDAAAVRKKLRRFAARERLRIAARELDTVSGTDVDVTARELADLADVCIEVALNEALLWADRRFGIPTKSD
ncbi:MAG TPA: hypothetical protein VNO21_23530, partial [Polyangiaceae bacterium]|nr:hypothetical protein [Polyangiaceae bacterium]